MQTPSFSSNRAERPAAANPRNIEAGVHAKGTERVSSERSGVPQTELAALLAAVNQLASMTDLDAMLRQAVEIARGQLGLERVRICLRDPCTLQLCGTWGTGARGEITDEHQLKQACGPVDYEALNRNRSGAGAWLYVPVAMHYAIVERKRRLLGRGWSVATPLVHAGELVGMMYNDSALTDQPMSEKAQLDLAVLCGLLAPTILLKRGAQSAGPSRMKQHGALVGRALEALSSNPAMTGRELAGELRVTSSYLARAFKTETRISIVEYRNRIRVERFLAEVQAGRGSVREAAFDAGFRSYAQFHRVFRRLVGSSPGEHAEALARARSH